MYSVLLILFNEFFRRSVN